MSLSESPVVKKLQEYSIPLLAGVVAALVWANVDHASYEAVIHGSFLDGALAHAATLHFLVNDVFMALFFGIAMKEIVEACLPGGALNPLRRAVNPLLGTIGGVLGPIAVYTAWTAITGDASIRTGWGIPTATDIALAWLVARVAFGATHPAVSFPSASCSCSPSRTTRSASASSRSSTRTRCTPCRSATSASSRSPWSRPSS
jgi:Na+:H+ antiporter, NhaA family